MGTVRNIDVYERNPVYRGRCNLCWLSEHKLTTHHLVPKSLDSQLKYRDRKVRLCIYCHDFLHRRFKPATLASQLNTLGKLRSHPAVQLHSHSRRVERYEEDR